MTTLKKTITFIAFILVAWGSYNLGKATWCTPDQKIADSPNRPYFENTPTLTPQIPLQSQIRPTEAQEWPVTAYYNTDPISHDFTFRWEQEGHYEVCTLDDRCFKAFVKGKSGSMETISMSKNFFDYFADPREGKVKLIIKELR